MSNEGMLSILKRENIDMEFLFSRDLIGFEWMRGARRWRAVMFWRPMAPWRFETWGGPRCLAGWMTWLWSRFVFFEKEGGYIGGCGVDQRTWRVLGIAAGFRDYYLE